MQTPDELLSKLTQFEDIQSAVAIYREAGNIAKLYRDVQTQAADCARSGMALDGVIKCKTESGSAGWTVPKAAKLDRAKWAAAMESEPALCEYQQRFEAMKAALEDAQDRAGCLVVPGGRFYIR